MMTTTNPVCSWVAKRIEVWETGQHIINIAFPLEEKVLAQGTCIQGQTESVNQASFLRTTLRRQTISPTLTMSAGNYFRSVATHPPDIGHG